MTKNRTTHTAPVTSTPTLKGTPEMTEPTPTTTARISFTELPDPATISALTEFCHRNHINLTVKGLTRKGAPKVNPEGEVILSFADINQTVSLPNPKAARKWLRKHSLSVTTCRKEGATWIFLKATAAVKVHFNIK